MSHQDIIKEIGQIRSLMERSSKFMSISGLSGILIGSYALLGSFFGYITVYGFRSDFRYRDNYITDYGIINKLILIAALVLFCSIVTGVLMARHKAKKNKQTIWNATSKALLGAMAVPLLTGGILSIILVYKGEYGMIASTLLIFYGLSLSAASTFTFKEARWLGVMDILLGLLALCFPGYGLWFWSIGFGVLHIIYGIIVHQRYEK
ncbi:hypothetical protein SAMN05660841_01265 [Sphingobacterium nematocida]|uniref:DUF998 domain-containing protein n=1 Tax=Sphingobacterium nematocida TaxID=1513896 RepID=A0A1T5CBE7_9SPHI|nr:hypothetical protein [Sphingobacterium nematocida]SKB56430.1 hypothetical protein SAMN05660841_01265 [Sphingobacterium nematocida]